MNIRSTPKLQKCADQPLPPWLARSLGVAVLFGFICQWSQYLARTSLWYDEAALALNLVNKTYSALTGPLEFSQAAPPLFLVLEKLAGSSFGPSEYAFRLIPLLSASLALLCFSALAVRLLGKGWAAVWAVLLLGASRNVIELSNMAKPYTLDLLFGMLFTWLAIVIWESNQPRRPLIAWGLTGALALWLSYGSAFVLGSMAVALPGQGRAKWRGMEWMAYSAAVLAISASFFFLLGPIRAQTTGSLVGYWINARGFPDTSSFFAVLKWLASSNLALLHFVWQPGWLIIALTITGAACLWSNHQRFELLILLLPLLLALAASFLHRWPYSGRLMAFGIPLFLLLTAKGIEGARVELSRFHSVAGWLLVAGVLCPETGSAAFHIVSPRQRHEFRPVVEFVNREMRPADQLLVFAPVEVGFYMGRDFSDAPMAAGASSRVWFIGTRHAYKQDFGASAQSVFLSLVSRRARLESKEEYGAAAYLFGPEKPANGSR